MPLKIPTFSDALPSSLGEKVQPETPIRPTTEWDLVRHSPHEAVWKDIATGKLQVIPNLSTLGPRRPEPQKTVAPIQKTPEQRFKPGDYIRYGVQHFEDETINTCIGFVDHVEGDEVWCRWSDENYSDFLSYALASEIIHCDAEGWIPATATNFPGVRKIKYVFSKDGIPINGIWDMADTINSSDWARQVSFGLVRWKPVL